MRRFVLDCSVAMSWCFEDEGDSYARFVQDEIGSRGVIVPSIWCMELINALVVGERRGRLAPAESAEFLSMIRKLPIEAEAVPPKQTLDDILSLARSHNLSAYDAAYLQLAMRSHLPIATLDVRLADAARQIGVPLLGTD
ncbi:MAG: type II toxin-antitoxin system VapC family toxin [Armatimonadetes bacterium]|nr:type II toxin-antitoxin system VapC family toxin [Armatimonadota bacterium]